MRQIIHHQLTLVEPPIDHSYAKELMGIGLVLDRNPKIAELVHDDLIQGLTHPDTGRENTMTADQVYRVLILKQMNGYSYEELAYHLADSTTYRAFCHLGISDGAPSASALQRDIKQVQPETLEAINHIILADAVHAGIEKGRKVRVDCTVVESNIHHPTDSSLLVDSVRVLSRLMGRARENLVDLDIVFTNHHRRARKRALEILNTRKPAKTELYRDLITITRKTVGYAENVTKLLASHKNGIVEENLLAQGIADDLKHYIPLAVQVISQAERRVLHNEKVPSAEKVLSIFEPHTDIIVKDRRDPHYGHKITLTGGASGLFTDLVVEEGNPADSTLALDMIARQIEIYGRAPRQAAFDGGFASKDNLADIKQLGVKDVAFHKKRGLTVNEMVKSTWVYKRLRNFRAGIEGMISFLKRCMGLRRCNWRGFESFKAYAWASVVTANVLLIARHMLAAV